MDTPGQYAVGIQTPELSQGLGLIKHVGKCAKHLGVYLDFQCFSKRDCNVFKVLLKSCKLYLGCQPNLGMNSEINGTNENICSI